MPTKLPLQLYRVPHQEEFFTNPTYFYSLVGKLNTSLWQDRIYRLSKRYRIPSSFSESQTKTSSEWSSLASWSSSSAINVCLAWRINCRCSKLKPAVSLKVLWWVLIRSSIELDPSEMSWSGLETIIYFPFLKHLRIEDISREIHGGSKRGDIIIRSNS